MSAKLCKNASSARVCCVCCVVYKICEYSRAFDFCLPIYPLATAFVHVLVLCVLDLGGC